MALRSCAAAAALFDAGENVFLLLTLGGHGGSFGPPVATTFASIKFLLITIAIVYALWGLVSRLRWRRRSPHLERARAKIGPQ